MKQIRDFPNKSNLENTDLLLLQDGIDNAYKNCTKEQLLAGFSGSPGNVVYPVNFTHWHDESIVVSGGTILQDLQSGARYGVEFYQEPPASGNSFKLQRLLTVGNYTLNILGSRNNSRGIVALTINGIQQFNDLDTYGSSLVRNIIYSRSIAIASSGLQEFVFSINGKNAASNNFYLSFTKLWVTKQ